MELLGVVRSEGSGRAGPCILWYRNITISTATSQMPYFAMFASNHNPTRISRRFAR